jgi:hypothetical protein
LAKSDFHFRSPREKSGFFPAIGAWFRGSYRGWKWLTVILPLQAVSAWTNVMGMRLALDWPIAVVMGLGLQAIALYIGLGLINATEEDRPGWKRALLPVLAISVFFSFAGFTSVYAQDLENRTLPLRQKDDLKDQALDLSAKVDEARRLAMSAYQNRIDYANEVKTAVRTRQQTGSYPDPLSAEKAINDQDQKIAAATTARKEWEEFAFDAQAPLSAATVSEGFSQLQDAYGRLGSLVGKLRKEESSSFRMPDPPLPTIAAAENVGQKDLISQAFGHLLSLSGLFWLILAIFLEAIPFWVAHANPAVRDHEDEEEPDLLFEQKMDERLAREVAAFNGMIRPTHMVASSSMADVEGQIARSEPVVEEMRRSVVEAVRLKRLERDTATRQRKLELLVEHARMRGVPEEVIKRIVEEDFNELLKEFGVEDMRLEKIRESRRDQVLADDHS